MASMEETASPHLTTVVDSSVSVAPAEQPLASARRRVVILRGVSGSGKSTYVAALLQQHATVEIVRQEGRGEPGSRFYCICSADDYFVDPHTGVYRFDPRDISQAHQWCRSRFLAALLGGTPLVIVDNTHTQRWEYDAFRKIGLLAGYEAHVVEFRVPDEATLQKVHERNRHNVPYATTLAQWRRFELDEQATEVVIVRA